ncbi:MAG: hypothetical protein ABI091_03655 [Ferruginibacter sp.]
MSLDNIQFSAELVKDLYSKSLVDLDTANAKESAPSKKDWTFLGGNKKNILLIVTDSNNAYLPDNDLNFLMGILGACKLTMADVALVNCFSKKDMDYKSLGENFSPHKIIFFGTEPSSLDFPLQFPNYQLQKYNHQVYLAAPTLALLAKDVSEKKQLWGCLKTLFEIG